MSITKEQVRKALDADVIRGDGHTIYAPSFYEDHFDVAHLEVEYESDYSNGKSTIYDNEGVPMDKTTGVYNLSFLRWVASELGLDYRSKGGRGSQAQEIARVISVWSKTD